MSYGTHVSNDSYKHIQYIQKINFTMFSVTEVLVEVPLENRIRESDMSLHQQEQFLNMMAYLTEDELEELRGVL